MIVNHIYRWAAEQPGKTAIIHDDVPISYAEFAASIDTARRCLSGNGLPVGMTAVVLVDDFVRLWSIVLALRSLGMDTVCVEALADVETLKLTNIGAVVTTSRDAVMRKITRPRAFGRKIIIVPDRIRQVAAGAPPAPIDDPERPYGGHILYTSGTTGDHKKVMKDGRHEEAQVLRCIAHRHIEPDSIVHMLAFGIWSGVGFKQPLSVWRAGATVVADQGGEVLAGLFRHQPSLVSMPPGTALDFLARTATVRRPARMPLLNLAGGFVSPQLLKRLRNARFDRIMVSYGSTECSHVLRSNVADEDDVLWLTPVADRDIEIVDENGGACAVGQEGLLRVGLLDHDAHGYLDDPETSASVFRDGWFYPGDLAVRREDGRIRILGRASDVLNMRGAKVPVAPLEQTMREVLGIERVCLFQGVDEHGVEELVVAIEAEAPPAKALADRIAAQFPAFERVRFEAVPEFPRTGELRKVKRLELRKRVFGRGEGSSV